MRVTFLKHIEIAQTIRSMSGELRNEDIIPTPEPKLEGNSCNRDQINTPLSQSMEANSIE